MKDNLILKKILLVDDSEIDLMINRKFIENEVIAESIVSKHSASCALEYLRRVEDDENLIPDFIFLDIKMPEMDGFEFLEQFGMLKYTITEKTKVIMVSSSIDMADISRANKINMLLSLLISLYRKKKLNR